VQVARAREFAVAVDDERGPPSGDRVDDLLAHSAAEAHGDERAGDRKLGGAGDRVEAIKGWTKCGAEASVVWPEALDRAVGPFPDRLCRGDAGEDRVRDPFAEQSVCGRRRVACEDCPPFGKYQP